MQPSLRPARIVTPNRNVGGRRRQRGAMMLESVIVVVFMTGVLLCIWYMTVVFSAKWGTLQRSRSQAWNTALNGCSDDNIGSLYNPIHQSSLDPNSQLCANADCEHDQLQGMSSDSTTPPDWFPHGQGDGFNSRTVNTNSFAAITISTHRHFTCNEKPHKELELSGDTPLSAVTDIVKKIIDEEVTPPTKAVRCQVRTLLCDCWRDVSCTDCDDAGKDSIGHGCTFGWYQYYANTYATAPGGCGADCGNMYHRELDVSGPNGNQPPPNNPTSF